MTDVEESSTERERLVAERFVIPKTALLGRLHTAVAQAAPTAKEAAKIFYENLESAFMVAGIPYNFADSSVLMRRHNQIMISEEIRALKGVQPNEPITEQARTEAHIIANQRFEEELQDERKVDQFNHQIRYDLYVLMQRNDVDRASHDLLLETVIMVWGSFEVFIADFVRSHLNAYPGIATRLLTDPSTKASFDIKSIGIEDLTANQFNVSNAMGNILVSKRRLDGIEVIRNVLKVMFPHHQQMIQNISTPELYKLAQRRHLIVHRRGSVDAAYLQKTNDNYQIGQTLRLTSEYIYQVIYLVRDIGIAVLDAVATSPEVSSHDALITYMTTQLPGETAMATVKNELGLKDSTLKKLKEVLGNTDHPTTTALRDMGVRYVVRGNGRSARSFLIKDQAA